MFLFVRKESLLLLALLIQSGLSAATEIWTGSTSSNLGTNSNWNGNAVPNQPFDIAQFDASGVSVPPTSSSALTLSNILFPSVSPATYTLTFSSPSTTSISCDNGGIVNQTPNTQRFHLTGSALAIQGNSPNSQNVLLNLSAGSTVSLAENSISLFNLSGTDATSTVTLLGNTQLVVGSANASTSYAGMLFNGGSDNQSSLTKIGTGTLTLTGSRIQNNSSTTISQGTFAISSAENIGTGNLLFSPGSTGSLEGTLQFDDVVTLPNNIQLSSAFSAVIDSSGFATTLSGPITDSTPNGTLLILNSIVQLSSTANTYSATTVIATPAELQALGSGVFSPNSPMIVNGTLCNAMGADDYTNSIWSLSGDGEVCVGQSGGGELDIVGDASTVFYGTLEGTGLLALQGQGSSLELTGDSSVGGSTVGISVGGGTFLAFNGILGGSIAVSSGGELSGDGIIFGGVTNDGSISPGNSIGTLTIGGSYVQGPDATYFVEVDGFGDSDLISVIDSPGTAVLQGGQVVVIPDGSVNFNGTYTILEAPGGVSGQFSSAVPLRNNLFIPFLSYTPQTVLLSLKPSIINGAVSFNERQVATQLDTVDPDAQMNELLGILVALPPSSVTEVLDQLSGNQHTVDPFIVGMLNREFVRRLYDPIRSIVTGTRCPCGFDVWLEGSWDRAFLQNDGNGFGFNLSGYEVTLGVQNSFSDLWTVGVAGSYAHDYIHYNIGGHGKLSSGFVGAYGLYRPSFWYAIGDLAFGYSSNKIYRPITVGSLRYNANSRTQSYDLIGYVEAGVDFPLCFVLIQPFAGVECNTYWRDKTVENGAGDIDLTVNKKTYTTATSRIGVHLNSEEYWTLSLSIDAAWNCRLTEDDFCFEQSFAGFGGTFQDKAVRPNRNSVEGAVTISSQITDWINTYVQAAGEVRGNASSYSFLLGTEFSW